MSITKNVNADVQNENATDHIDTEQTTLIEQTLTKKMKNEEILTNDVYKRRYGTLGCDHHRLVCARQHYRSYLDDEYDDILDKISAYLERFLDDELCSNCIIAYDRGHERGGEWQYRNGFNIGFESALEEMEKIIDTMNLPNKRENAVMIKKYIHENDCRRLNELDFPYLNELGCGYIEEEYIDEEYGDIDDEIEAELAWYFEAQGILEDGICDTCIAAYHRGHERGGEGSIV